ncbi:MAG TPA: hypothetical protein VM681_03300 [Candidatus Thermoplasmatota archaeon]|nr:hypothetical protein [Candidatus Thermoplasmatota archaeon]
MQLPHELVVFKFLPVLRGQVVRILLSEHKLKQTEIARAMGITQAAVSHYFHADRGHDEPLLSMFPEIGVHARSIASAIAEGASEPMQVALFAKAVNEMMSTERFCSYHKASSGIEQCNVCFEENFARFVPLRGSP